ncbi:hypothetical protein AWC12_03465 [Mycolicibacterium iranicum]|uniref:Uncharacterized protein n=2 Tax=Mycolicibacterium iranicum TaxID=912594 RepID=A0A1X1WYM0_MYCIR|nr:hypothetical protein AWC12_03465 [Mycolicibacterium iranicum]
MLGLRQAFGYEIGQKQRTASEAAGIALVIWLPLSGLSAAGAYLTYGRQLPGLSAFESGAIIFIGVAGLLLISFTQGIFLGRGDISAYALTETLNRLVLMAIVVALTVFAAVSLQSALWAFNGGIAVSAMVGLFLALRGAGRPSVDFRKFGSTLRYGIVNGANFVLINLCARLSMFVIEHEMGAAAAGQFFAAIRVYEIVVELATAAGLVLFSDAARQDKTSPLLNRNARIACWIFWIFLALGVVVAASAPLVIVLLVGSQYAAGAHALQLMAISLGPTAASRVLYSTQAGRGNPYFGTPIIVASLIVNTVLAFALVPSLGISGGALALVFGQYLLFAGYLVRYWLSFKVPLRDLLVPRQRDFKLVGVRAYALIFSLRGKGAQPK